MNIQAQKFVAAAFGVEITDDEVLERCKELGVEARKICFGFHIVADPDNEAFWEQTKFCLSDIRYGILNLPVINYHTLWIDRKPQLLSPDG